MITLESAAGRTSLAGAREDVTVLHAHYYDAALHRAITETGSVDGRLMLERAAASAAYRAAAAAPAAGSPADRLERFLAATGLGGIAECESTEERSMVVISPSHAAAARTEMFGPAPRPVCDIARGVIAGAAGAIHGRTYEVVEQECVGTGRRRCRFVATPLEASFDPGPALEWAEPYSIPPPDPGFPSAEVLAPVAPVPGAPPPGASYGRLWAELYARAAHAFEQEVPRAMGPKYGNLPSVVLTEAAHLGIFYSVGGLIRSPEWLDRVAPRLPSREDWIHALVALVDSFGWGSWRVRLLAPEQRFTVHVHDGYEAVAHVGLHGQADSPRCYFARGLVAALMNVLYAGDALAPAALNQSVYNSLFRSPMSFRAIETRCQAMGHPYCEFVANPLSPGLRLAQDLGRV